DPQAVGHLDDRVDMGQQGTVVGDDQCGSAARAQQGGQQCASVLDEVVARLIEDEPVVADQSGSGQTDPGRLAAGEGVQPPVEVVRVQVQAEVGHGRQCPFLDVPVRADEGESGCAGFPGQSAVECGSDIADAEGGVDTLLGLRQQLVDVDGMTGAGDRSRGGGQEPGEHLRECGFADPVVPDQADEAGGDGGGQLGEDLGVVAEAAVQSGHSDGSGHEGPQFVHAEA